MVCFSLCSFHLMCSEGKGSWVRLRETGGNPVPFPSNRHSFFGCSPPQTAPEPFRDEQWRAGGSFPTSPKSLYQTAKPVRQGLSSTCLSKQGAGVALKPASRMATGAAMPALAMEQEPPALSFGGASWDTLFCAAPSSGMCLTNKVIYLELAGTAALHELPSQLGGSGASLVVSVCFGLTTSCAFRC